MSVLVQGLMEGQNGLESDRDCRFNSLNDVRFRKLFRMTGSGRSPLAVEGESQPTAVIPAGVVELPSSADTRSSVNGII
jgi:hypothetical protein